MKQQEKSIARKLRKQGIAITTISKQLNVAKSTVFEWTKDIQLTTKQRRQLHSLEGAMLGSAAMVKKYRLRRESWQLEGRERAAKDLGFRILCALYWGEGAKDRNTFSIANSDISMIQVVHGYIKETFPHLCPKLTVRAYLNPGFTKKDIEKKWAVLGLPTTFKWLKPKPLHRGAHAKLYYGTGHYSICNTQLVQTVFGGITLLREVGIAG